ncbi:MAG TPA: TIGR03936 family radical SAM-associated protein [Candidatus Atribacteria bacterium]|nr:TIGR03936 family radical SAM-associated protein [Candidatus Atribacteria bacterium]HPT77661.1 TIGR03936 family radical SAM-associated protein [Candidatus Atribacteria bacterium]
MRVLLEYMIGDRVRFISHLDFMRTIQRTIRRAGIPVAYSEGFNPHPKLSFGLPLPVGVTSSAEYMDIILSSPMDTEETKDLLNTHLPRGIAVTAAVGISPSAPSLMSLIKRADYRITLDTALPGLESGIQSFLQQAEIPYDKPGKKGVNRINIRDSVFSVEAGRDARREILVSMKTGGSSSVKPEVIAEKIAELAGVEAHVKMELTIHRTGLYMHYDGRWVTPLMLKEG